MTREQLLREAAALLRQAGVNQPWFEAQLLLASVLDVQQTEIIVHNQLQVRRKQVEEYRQMVAQRQQRKPMAYIIGSKQFLEWDFTVSPAVLIPRPETEILVELAVEQVLTRFGNSPVQLADIGCGSGAIGLSMLKKLPQARLAAVDISSAAVEVARLNATNLGVLDRVDFYCGDLLQPLAALHGCLHCITANLPYVSIQQYNKLAPEIVEYEPQSALISGQDGLDHYRRLVAVARGYLQGQGLIFVEIGSGQSKDAEQLFSDAGFAPQLSLDLAGHPRVVWAAMD